MSYSPIKYNQYRKFNPPEHKGSDEEAIESINKWVRKYDEKNKNKVD